MAYNYNTFKELFDGEIHYAYEAQYGVHIHYIHKSDGSKAKAVTFHKLTVFDSGNIEYKGQYTTYDPRLWPQVLALAEMLIETKAEKVLYKK